MSEAPTLRKDQARGNGQRITRIIPVTITGEVLVSTDAFGQPMGDGGVVTVISNIWE